jgi:Domain of unknown function (DUF4389)
MEVTPPPQTLFATHPVRLRITDDLRRTRVTVFFRLILVIPHAFWLALIGVATFFAIIGNWFATLFAGQSPDALHNFIAGYIRYTTQVAAYVLLIADPYPGFYLINMEEYPVDLEVAPPEAQNRWTVAFRIILAIPALLIASVLRNISSLLAIFSWVMGVLTARVPEGIRNFAAFALRYEIQTYSYVALLTQKYPNFNVGVTE